MKLTRENFSSGGSDSYSEWKIRFTPQEQLEIRRYEGKNLHVFSTCVIVAENHSRTYYTSFENYMNLNKNADIVTGIVAEIARVIVQAYKCKDTYDRFPVECNNSFISIDDLMKLF